MSGGFNVTYKLATARFFDTAVADDLSKKGKRVLTRFGGMVRTIARRSIRPAPRKSPAELTESERDSLNRRFRLWAAGKIADKPKPPLRSSTPGKPPYYRWSKSPIRLILFSYDPTDQSVVIGPVGFGRRVGEATEALEYGGSSRNSRGENVDIEARPFMVPAFEKSLPLLSEWRKSL